MKKVSLQIVVTLLLPILPALFTGAAVFQLSEAKQSLQAEGEITLEEALTLNALWVDARSKSEFDAGHIPQALLINEDQWDAGLAALLERWDFEQPLVVYCSSQTCDASHAVAKRLKADLDFQKIYVLKGGWERWQSQ